MSIPFDFSFTYALHCSHILEWSDKKESDHPQNQAEAEFLSAARLYDLGRFCCHHAVLCHGVFPAFNKIGTRDFWNVSSQQKWQISIFP